MNNLMKYKGYFGSVEVSIEDNILHGKLECINDLVTYEANSIPELKSAFEDAVEDYLETCAEIGKIPDKFMSGTFNIRIGEHLHKQAYLAAKATKVSPNDYIKNAVQSAVSDKQEIHYHVSHVSERQEYQYEIPKKPARNFNWSHRGVNH